MSQQNSVRPNIKISQVTKIVFSLLFGLVLSICLNFIQPATSLAAPATFTVTNTNDTGAGSLRQAISDANTNSNPGDQDIINFNIAGFGDKTITPQSTLTITQSVLIDGFTQGDAEENTKAWPEAMDGTIRIGINNSTSGGLIVEGNNVELRGLNLRQSTGSEILVNGADGFALSGSYIGTDITGSVNANNTATGPQISLKGSHNSRIGGSSPSQRNVVAFGETGIIVIEKLNSKQSQGIVIQGNNIAIGSDGLTIDLSEDGAGSGIIVKDDSSDITIGGDADYLGNTIINIRDTRVAIAINDTAHNILVAGNVMQLNHRGISVNNTAKKIAIVKNSIFNNNTMGIDLNADFINNTNDANDTDTGPNDMLNSPGYTQITEGGGNTEVDFSIDVPAGQYRIEFFSNTVADPSGIGEGETYLGYTNITSDGSGLEEFSHTLSGTGHANLALTATEIDPSTPSGFGSTSEFGAAGQTVSPNLADLAITHRLLNPQDFALNATLNYQVTLYNNGPESVDIASAYTGSPGDQPVTFVLPPNLTFSANSGSDFSCTYWGDGSAVVAGSMLADHSTYGIGGCSYVGASPRVLATGDSISFTLSTMVTDDSDPDFTSYVAATPSNFDIDSSAYNTIISGGLDILTAATSSPNNLNNIGPATSSPTDVEGQLTISDASNVQAGSTIKYTLSAKNNGASALDLTQFDLGQPNPINQSVFVLALPPNLTYVSQSNSDMMCIDIGKADDLGGGPTFSDVLDHHLILCGYFGANVPLAAGQTISTTITANITTVPADFTAYLTSAQPTSDLDSNRTQAIPYHAVPLFTTALAQDINNFASQTYNTATFDQDSDGIPDQTEDSLAPDGDGNGDSIRDKLQSGVASTPNSLTGAYTTLAVTGDCNTITNFAVTSESAQSTLDSRYNYPLGLTDFTLTCATPGGNANVTIYYDKVYSADSYQVRKLMGSTYSNLVDATIGTATVNGSPVTTITYSLTDGGSTDTDSSTNSSITDPIGLGVQAPFGSQISDAIQTLANTGNNVWIILMISIITIVSGGILTHRASNRQ